ncbi:MAG: (2Fe-2S)-binding protein [Burkholderiales bacterium]|nr:(2Fe-2S)-binding protein [Burkholderiales bacterium]
MTLYRALDAEPREHLDMTIEGRRVLIPAGISVAAALLHAGIIPSRTAPAGGAPRAPYCMMGVCFECLVEIDGVPNRQGCMVSVAAGMRVRRQLGAPVCEP